MQILKHINTNISLRFFGPNVLSLLLFGSSKWKMTTTISQRLEYILRTVEKSKSPRMLLSTPLERAPTTTEHLAPHYLHILFLACCFKIVHRLTVNFGHFIVEEQDVFVE